MAFRPTSISKMFSSPALPLPLDYSLSSSLFARSSRQRLLVSRRSLSSNQKWRHSMFVGAKPVLKDGTLSFSGQDVLKRVPANIVLTPLTDSSAYVGATSTQTSSRHVFKIGVIEDVRLLCLYRFKIWWMIPKVGTSGSDIPIETQMLLLESRQGEASEAPTSYIVFLPLVDGKFRSSLQGNSSNELEICVESGDPTIVTSQSLKAVFMNYGEHPFDLMKESMK